MREDGIVFRSRNQARTKEPRFVVAVLYDVDSIYITSHDDIPNVPGTVLQGLLAEPTLTSQTLRPDEGASTIGTASFSLVDVASQFTDEVRERLDDGAGLRGRRCRFYVGYKQIDFSNFVLVGTQDVIGAEYDEGQYRVSCADLQRSLRSEIFDIVETTLAVSISATATTITLTSATGLQLLAHGTSYTDAPSQTVGYIKIKDEIIRYTGISGNDLTGCTRGVFGTVAAAYTVDPAMPAERREKVSEYVYLELPAVKLAYAILTGELYGSANTLPDGWHLGVDPALVRSASFTGIGSDLWNLSDDTAGFVVRFDGLKKQDGKRFLEKEIYLPTGLYSPVHADGTLGLKRMVRLREDAATVATLTEDNSIQVGELMHDMRSLHNVFDINWSWDGKEFRRKTKFVDVQSRSTHGAAPTMALSFRGLFGALHTDGVIFKSLDFIRDRYAGPPVRMTVELLPSMNRIEVGDVIRAKYSHVRDFTEVGTSMNRAMEVQNVRVDWRRRGVALELFGSTADPSVDTPTTAATALPDSYYNSQGTPLASAPGITILSNVITAATQALQGNADLNNGGAIYYHEGNLTVGAGVTLTIAANVQLRVRGFFQVNGTISGVGGGRPGVVDDSRTLLNFFIFDLAYDTIPGAAGYVGASRGSNGMLATPSGVYGTLLTGIPTALTPSQHPAAPAVNLAVSGSAMNGLPSDLRGAGGAPGGRVELWSISTQTSSIAGLGGTGGAGGAGLAIICRGMALGVNGLIDLSGTDSPAPSQVTANGTDAFPGAGGAGGPGTMYVLLDGSNLSVPDIGSKFRARTGAVPIPNANPMPAQLCVVGNPGRELPPGYELVQEPVRGQESADTVTSLDLSGAALRVQYVPAQETAVPDQDSVPAAPTALTAVGGERIITVRVTPGGQLGPNDYIEVFASINNDRVNAVRFAYGSVTEFTLDLPAGGARWFWTRIRRERAGPDLFSDWQPSSATNGVLATALDFVGELPSRVGVFLDTFDHEDWERFYNGREGSATITYPANGENGGRVLRSQGHLWIAWKKNIPYDPTQIYLMTVQARMVQAPTGGVSTQDMILAGFEGIAADGETLINRLGANFYGSQHWGCASEFDFGTVTLGEWRTFRGYFSGHSSSPSPLPAPSITNPLEMYTGVRFIRPVVIVNYNGGNGIMDVDYIRVDRANQTGDIVPGTATQIYTFVGGNGSITGTLSTPQILMSVSVPAQEFETTVVVTFVCNMRAVSAEFGGCGVWGYINNTSLGIGYDSTDSNARCRSPTAGIDQVNSVTVEESFSLPANTARTYNMYAFRGGGGPSATANYVSGVLKAEVIKV